MRKFLLKKLAAIPMPLLYRLTWPLYLIIFHVGRYRRSIAEKNIRNSFPNLSNTEQRSLLKKFYKNFCEVILEILKTINISPQQLSENINFENIEELERALENDQTIVLTLAHQCNMEWPILALCNHIKFPVDGIYKPLHQKWLNDLTVESRSKFDISLIPAKTCITDLIKRSKQTRIVAIAPDQAPRRRDDAHWTTFLNQETPFYLGLENIATLFKYPVYFMQIERTGRGKYSAKFKQLCLPPYPKNSSFITQAYAEAVEEQVKKNPQDWLWIHKRWKKKKSLYS